jgi:hypothetical protein
MRSLQCTTNDMGAQTAARWVADHKAKVRSCLVESASVAGFAAGLFQHNSYAHLMLS